MNKLNKIRCNAIEYRQGFIEVQSRIHEDCINIETWQINPDINITNLNLTDEEVADDDITGNTEIELSLKNAEYLINLLQAAISDVKSGGNA